MDCQTARQDLEAARPGSDDLLAVDLAPAAEHLKGCAACQNVFRQQERLDLRIGALCRNIAVPAGLKERLWLSLQSPAPATVGVSGTPSDAVVTPSPANEAAHGGLTSAATPQPLEPQPLEPKLLARPDAASPDIIRPEFGRRSVVRIVVTVAACLAVCAFVGQWLLKPPSPTIDIASVEQAAKQTVEGSEATPAEVVSPFIGSFTTGLSPAFPQRMQLPGTNELRKPGVVQVGPERAAVFLFSVRTKAKSLPGSLIVLPRVLLKGAPAANAPIGPHYNGRYVTMLWVEGDLVFFVCLRGDVNQLDRLFRQDAS